MGFRDGSPPVTTSQNTISHTYLRPGIYNVTHKAINSCGESVIVKTVTVQAPPATGQGVPWLYVGLTGFLGFLAILALNQSGKEKGR